MKRLLTILLCIGAFAGLIRFGVNYLDDHSEAAKRQEAVEEAVERVRELDLGLDTKFYYGELDSDEQEAYEVIVDGVRSHSKTITVSLTDADQANEVFQRVLMDFPEYFWCSGSVKTIAYSGASGFAQITPIYAYTEEEAEKREDEITEAAAGALAQMDEEASDYEKVKYVYEYIVNSTEYVSDAEDSQNLYSVLIGKKSVCAGYARAMQYLLEQCGIPCIYVVGTVDGGEAHAWNIVKCDGDWYQVDATWGDPVFAKQVESIAEDNITYDYLCCSDAELLKTHQPDESYAYPACDSEALNYYRLTGSYYTEYKTDQAYRKMQSDIDGEKDRTVFKYADADVYETACKGLIDEGLIADGAQYLCRRYGLDKVNYYYQKEDKMNKIAIFWEYDE